MQLTKRSLIKTAAIGSALVGALALAAPASAEDFGPTDYGTGSLAEVSYNDEQDYFCAKATTWSGASIRIKPYIEGRGPTHDDYIFYGQTKCYFLTKAYEDSDYYYEIGPGGLIAPRVFWYPKVSFTT